LQIIHEPNDNYVEVKNCSFERKEAFQTFYSELKEKYPGCTFDFVYTETDAPEELMHEIGAELIDSCVEMRLTEAEEHGPVESCAVSAACVANTACAVEPVTPATFDVFAEIHDRKNPDMYWTSARIKADMARWRIYRADDGYILLGIWDAAAEVYALEAADIPAKASLLRQACTFAFRINKTGVVWMVDEDKPEEIKMAEVMGFVRTGGYRCYRVGNTP
jgi:hypothetical protein